jgi:hypothetical protein
MIPIRVYLYAALVVILTAGCFWLHHSGYASGVAHEVAIVAANDAKAKADAEQREAAMRDAYNNLAHRYEQDKSDAQTQHDRDVAALRDGTLRLQDKWACSNLPSATVRSRELDAAATQRLADRTKAAIEIVQLGYDADQREAELAAQVRALQGVVKADRQ